MLPLADAVKVRSVGSIEALLPAAPVADVRQEAFERSIQRLIGQQFQGEILSRLKDGTFLVRVAGTATRMTLPDGAKAGTSIPMTLLSVQPRPTFLLGTEISTTTTISASATSLNTNGLPTEGSADHTSLVYIEPDDAVPLDTASSHPRTTRSGVSAATQLIDHYVVAAEEIRSQQNNASAPASLSAAGKLINSVLLAAQENNAPSFLMGKTAIVSSPTTPAENIALALHDTLKFSGLFYESHLVEWAEGKRSIAALMLEPQMQKSNPIAPLQTDGKPIEFPQIINLQLSSLEQQSTHWRGEVWPGQTMEWEVHKDTSQDTPEDRNNRNPNSNDDDSEAASWHSAVRFNFPHLGSVLANIRLMNTHVQIHINTPTENVAATLRTHIGALADALTAAGTSLDSMTVKHHDGL